METFVSSAILAAITALAFVAYRHPDSYSKLSTLLLVGGILAYIAIGIYDLGAIVATEVIAQKVDSSQSLKVREYAATARPQYFLVTLAFVAYSAVILLLLALPVIGLTASKDDSNRKIGEKRDDKD